MLPDHHHRNLAGGWARAAVFGVSDGLVTNVSLILGMAGAHPAQGVVRLAGLAGLVGGAFSMAAGEYVSMR
ncbi:MAG: VIT1/CCC1 transporter family protein, partial [Acidimicrobiales bacterium]